MMPKKGSGLMIAGGILMILGWFINFMNIFTVIGGIMCLVNCNKVEKTKATYWVCVIALALNTIVTLGFWGMFRTPVAGIIAAVVLTPGLILGIIGVSKNKKFFEYSTYAQRVHQYNMQMNYANNYYCQHGHLPYGWVQPALPQPPQGYSALGTVGAVFGIAAVATVATVAAIDATGSRIEEMQSQVLGNDKEEIVEEYYYYY